MRMMTIEYAKNKAKATNRIAERTIAAYNAKYPEEKLIRGGTRRTRNVAEQKALDGFILK